MPYIWPGRGPLLLISSFHLSHTPSPPLLHSIFPSLLHHTTLVLSGDLLLLSGDLLLLSGDLLLPPLVPSPHGFSYLLSGELLLPPLLPSPHGFSFLLSDAPVNSSPAI